MLERSCRKDKSSFRRAEICGFQRLQRRESVHHVWKLNHLQHLVQKNDHLCHRDCFLNRCLQALGCCIPLQKGPRPLGRDQAFLEETGSEFSLKIALDSLDPDQKLPPKGLHHEYAQGSEGLLFDRGVR